jgi:hypothetical protein
VAGWVLAVCSMVSRPCSCQTSAKSFRKPCENAVRLPTGRPFGLPETPGGPHPAVHMFGRLKRHSFCFLLLICAQPAAHFACASRLLTAKEGWGCYRI